jgi:chromosome segregation ATPase
MNPADQRRLVDLLNKEIETLQADISRLSLERVVEENKLRDVSARRNDINTRIAVFNKDIHNYEDLMQRETDPIKQKSYKRKLEDLWSAYQKLLNDNKSIGLEYNRAVNTVYLIPRTLADKEKRIAELKGRLRDLQT